MPSDAEKIAVFVTAMNMAVEGGVSNEKLKAMVEAAGMDFETVRNAMKSGDCDEAAQILGVNSSDLETAMRSASGLLGSVLDDLPAISTIELADRQRVETDISFVDDEDKDKGG